jgi:hypothetical protein
MDGIFLLRGRSPNRPLVFSRRLQGHDPVIEGQFFSDLNIAKSNNPDTTSGEFGYTIRRTGMVDVAGSVAEHSAINVILSAEGKNIDIPLGYALGTFGFRNAFPYIPDNPGIFCNFSFR